LNGDALAASEFDEAVVFPLPDHEIDFDQGLVGWEAGASEREKE